MSIDLAQSIVAIPLALAGLFSFLLGAYRFVLTRRLERLEAKHLQQVFKEYTVDVELSHSAKGEKPFRIPAKPKRRKLARPRISLSFALVGCAVRRLPPAMTEAEKARWAQEMRADAASIPRGRFRRLRFALNLWRKGAPAMPAGEQPAARPARD